MQIRTSSFEKYRDRAMADGLSPRTIESTVDAIRLVVAAAGYGKPDAGLRVPKPAPQPNVPTANDISKFCAHAHAAVWPENTRVRWLPCEAHVWWRCFALLAIWTGYRLSDLLDLRWRDIDEKRFCFAIEASKTRQHARGRTPIPIVPVVTEHLEHLRGRSAYIFGRRITQMKQLRRGMREICTKAGIDPITPQSLRRFAVTNWSAASSRAGGIIHGADLGVLKFYLDRLRILERAAPSVTLPNCFARSGADTGRNRLLNAFDSSDPETQKLLVDLVTKIGGRHNGDL